VSESGAGTTWSRNSRLNRLTPWSNDPIVDPYGEALYVRDEEAGVFWSPLPGPVAPLAPFEVRHGFGYSRWRHVSRDLEQEVCLFVPRHDPVKVIRVRLRNTRPHARRLSVFWYAQLVLGDVPAPTVVTEFDAATGTLLARNPASGDFTDGVVLAAAVPQAAVRFTADGAAFLGPDGVLDDPAGVAGSAGLDGRTGAGLDACAALQVELSIAPHASVECAFLLGETTDAGAARTLVARYRKPRALDEALDEVRAYWQTTLSAVQVETPCRGLDLMANGWLLYQTLACRLWGRSAFYQSGGSFGFRDQLQDAPALEPGEDEQYLLPEPSGETADVYTHCCRALDRSLTRGAHGLPLMGTGDWNDGMNRVRREGQGESVWLGFFLFFVPGEFIPLCEQRADHERAGRYRDYRGAVRA